MSIFIGRFYSLTLLKLILKSRVIHAGPHYCCSSNFIHWGGVGFSPYSSSCIQRMRIDYLDIKSTFRQNKKRIILTKKRKRRGRPQVSKRQDCQEPPSSSPPAHLAVCAKLPNKELGSAVSLTTKPSKLPVTGNPHTGWSLFQLLP